ncbi:putative reverse transcriptase zinc-binding domain-containing protein [Helianthus anomalus]
MAQVYLQDRRDTWVWIGDSDGKFSVGAMKRLLGKGTDRSNNFVLEWCKWIPIKCNVFCWRAEMDQFPTKTTLRNRNIIIDDTLCPICGCDDESVDYLFTGCGVATIVWLHISSWCRGPTYMHSPFVTSWLFTISWV